MTIWQQLNSIQKIQTWYSLKMGNLYTKKIPFMPYIKINSKIVIDINLSPKYIKL